MAKYPYYLVLDVESLGLHGVGFAYGFVVVDENGHEVDSRYAAIKPDLSEIEPDTLKFLQENVLSALWGWTHQYDSGDDYAEKCRKWVDFRWSFWEKWMEWKEKGAALVVDCGWPVEARFLAQCVDDKPEERAFAGPYPLLDVSTMLLAAGEDPLAPSARQFGELPVHNPLADARQSARRFITALQTIGHALL